MSPLAQPPNTVAPDDKSGGSLPASEFERRSRAASVARMLSFRNISGVYIFAVIFITFALWTPDSFLTAGVWRTLLDAQTITALAALAALIPLVTGLFDLAVGAEIGMAGIASAWLISHANLPIPAAIALTLLVGLLIGLISGLLVTKVRIDSFIATLGMSSVLLAVTAWLSNSQQILNLGSGFSDLALTEVFGITLPVYIVFVITVITWYVLERTPIGRQMYAVGYNADAARLSGIAVNRLRICALMAGGALTALAGLLLSARLNAGDPTVGPEFLLPALTAVFLGSTQFRGGRYNVWGTILAVYVLAVGIKGLQLVGAPGWINDMFNGLALLIAVGMSGWERATSARASLMRRVVDWRAGRGQAASDVAGG